MNRFQKQKNAGKNVRSLAAPVLLAVAVIGCVWNGITSVSDQTARQQKKSLEEAIRRDMVTCYAMEGVYPESLDYLKEHAPSVMSPILCTELTDNQKISLLKEGEIEKGEPLFAVNIYE